MIDELMVTLHAQNCSCVIANRGEVRCFRERGIKDLYQLYISDKQFLSGAVLADKVVGKAAAALMIMGGVKQIYADVISIAALNLLAKTNITVQYAESAPYIINRSKTDLCPMEKATQHINDLDEIFHEIDAFVSSLATQG